MAVLYGKTKFDTPVDPISLTEQEHLDSCDINKMVKAASRGMQVRGGPEPKYGDDDTTMSQLDVRIELERNLDIVNNHEFEQKELDHIPKSVQQQFKLRKKQATNDDKTTNQPSSPATPPTTPPSDHSKTS